MALGGATEATVWSNWFPVGTVDPAWPSIPYGRPIANARYYLLDEALAPCPIGVAGDLYIGGGCLCTGYARRPELTAAAFLPDSFADEPGARLYRTGDRARALADGNLEFLGRLDQQVKIRGYRIELGEIEVALARHPAVREAVVLARVDEPGDPRLVAYVVPAGEPSASELRDALRRSLPESMIPAAFVFLPALPVTPNGKLDRQALPAPQWNVPGGEGEAPRTPTETRLAAIWSEVLGMPRVGRDDGFFDLGGHSLLATQMLARVRAVCGVELSLRTLFEHPKLADLAAWIDAAAPLIEATEEPIVRAPRDGALPLSFAQQRLWFLDLMEPGSPLYHITAAVEMTGRLDVAVLAAALGEVVRRHEALRVTFRDVGGLPAMDLTPCPPLPSPPLPPGEGERPAEGGGAPSPGRWGGDGRGGRGVRSPELIDLQSLPERRRAAEADRLALAEARRPFDLRTGPLLRVTLLRTAPERHRLVLVLHHIVSDGWSLGVLVRELGALYAAFAEGRPSPLPELAIQVPDVAAWQRRHLAGAFLEAETAWWREQLAEMPAVLELPVDHPRPAVRSVRGAVHTFAIGRGELAMIAELARRSEATLFMTLLAAFAALLGKLTGQDDLAVGTPVAGRTRVETEPLIGLFVNTLVLRMDLAGDPDAAALLARVRETALAAFAHQELPFERLVEELAPERDLRRLPLVQVLFALQNAPAGPLELPGLELAVHPLDTGTAKFELTFVLTETADGLHGEIEYSADLFDAASIERLAGRYLRLLAAMTDEPHRHLSELPVLTAAEEAEVRAWNDTARPYPRDASLPELFAAVAAVQPEAPAVVDGAEVWSYRQLDEASSRLARHLQSLGVRPGEPVALSLERSAELVVGMLAILKAGGFYVPLDASYPEERRRWMLEDAGARVVVAPHPLAPSPTPSHPPGEGETGGCAVVDVGLWQSPPLPADGRGWERGPGGEGLAYLIYTSGSTGRPKGVAVPQSAVVRLVRDTDYVRLGPGSRVAMLANISFDAATWEIWGPLLNGGAAVVIPRDVVLSPAALATTLRAQRVTSLFLTTALFTKMAREVPDAFAGLDEVLFGGEQADPAAARAVLAAGPPRRLLHVYGPTESTTFASWHHLRAVAPDVASLPIGGPLANTTLQVLDPWLAPVPPGSPGELCIGGDGLAWGYWNRPELTAERFVPHPGEDGGRLYRTGDLVRRIFGGPLDFLGRIDQQVKIRGFRVEPGEIEAALLEHPAVREAAVAVVPGAGGLDDRRLAAWVAGDVEAAELRQLLRDKLPAHMVPSFLTVLPALPLTPSGKLDRRALLAFPLESGADEPAAPRTPVEELVAGIFAEVLGRERVGVAESFFELGGHSLLAAQVAARVRAVLGVELPVRTLFEASTVESLAAALTTLRAESAAPTEPPARVERPGPLPLTFAQERLWFLQQLEPGSDAYNMPVAVELAGALNLGAFTAALAEIVRRQESLRTFFPMMDGAPRQWIAPAADLPLPLVDLTDRPDGLAEAERLEREHAALGFDLERGPLARWLLVRLGAERHRFLLSLHHTIADGWSLGVLVRELGALYGAFCEGRPSPLPELPVQVADFAVWQRTWLAERQEAQLAYWESRLGGESAVAELPTDRPRPAVQTFHGGRRSLVLAPELTARLHGFGRGAGATLFMTLLAATQALLARHSGEPEVTVGAPIAGRPWKEIEGVIGCFLNTLALRTDTSGSPSFRELVARVRTVTLEAYAHQDVPFEAVLARLRLDRDLSRSPLFQVLFNLLSLPPSDLALPGLDLRVLTPAEVPSKLDATFYVSESDARVWIHLVYNADLFDEARIADLLAQLELLLAQAVERPDEPVDHLALVTAAARAVLPDPAAPLPVPTFPAVARLFLDRAEALPGQTALEWSGGSWTYAELSARALEIAEELRGAGAGVGAVVAVSGPRGPELIAGLLGVFLAGGVLLILDPRLPEARRRVMLGEAAPVCLLEESAEGWRIQALRDQPAASSVPGPDDPAYVFFTSGTTGRPKAVLGRQKGLSHFLTWQRTAFGIGPGDRAAQLTGLSFDVVLRDMFLPLTSGATLVLPDEDDFSPERLLSWLREREISVVHTVPSLASAWLGAAPAGFQAETLRWTFFAGEPLLAQVVTRWRAAFPRTEVINLYGPTETTLAKCFYQVPDPPVQDVQPVGTPLPQTQALILRNERPCGFGEVGEIVIRTPFRSLGYLNNPEENRRFRPNPFRDDPDDLVYVSGDRGRYRLDGMVEILGRLDEQVKIRGVRVEPAEIRSALGRHPAVWESAILVREQRPGDQRLVAYLVLRPGVALDPEDLRRHLRQELPEAMVPSTLVTVDALPLTPNGKLDRRALAQMGTEVDLTAGGDARRALLTPVEEIVAGVVGEVLGVARLGPDAHFFQLGGHSLSGAQVVSRLRQAFQVDLPLRVLFEAPTVAGLAAEVERLRLDGAPERPSISSFRQDRGAPAPLSLAQERFWMGRELEARTVASTIPTLILLRGDLDLGCLRAALQEIVDRHEVLRTTFREGPDGPVQVIHPRLPIQVPVIDLEPLGLLEQKAEIHRWSTFDGRTPFDYERGPLFRMKIFRGSERENMILFTIHHVAFDGWSRSVLINELTVLYNAWREGRPSSLRPLAAQYQDFARWQRRLLGGGALERETRFWREYLRGAVPVQLGRVRPPHPTWDAGTEPITIPEDLERRLDAFAAEQSVTLFITLLAAFKALVHEESGRSDVVVTCLFANRNQLETEDLIGNFFAGLPVRTQLAGARTFRELLERVRDETLRVHEHPDILYEPAMEGLSFLAPGERGGLATFRLLFQVAKLPPARQGLAGLDAIPVPFDSGKIRQDLSLFLGQGDRLTGRFKYNRDVLDAETVVRLRDRFLQILAAVVEDPDCRLESLLHDPCPVFGLESTKL
jgi:amino acid adenylation domain-containing protein